VIDAVEPLSGELGLWHEWAVGGYSPLEESSSAFQEGLGRSLRTVQLAPSSFPGHSPCEASAEMHA
jgi:hypothetical protein